ncbi:hypothetical protein FC826_13270 [Clostridium botulinum]|uniref:Uncharacterized protein n=1 Tax=Clostridium botulinum TaxID=1491 RepID=A0A6B4KCD4_CLOBO|nr:hypothetical protein [Clostridium botulinum]NFD84865.1 hypothetical protein [Clostridium botulinum]NFE09570.1 hypothetical protein [Clostridium botulinum]NFE36050.1 hypothetical protein [Clostridium botulinum]NFE50281.1 hypothetical protein [Clostridium botulinum]
MQFEQVSKLIEKLNQKRRIGYLATDEQKLLAELTFLMKIYTNTNKKISINESLGTSSNACPTCGRLY